MNIDELLDQTCEAFELGSDACVATSDGGAVFSRIGLERFAQLVNEDAQRLRIAEKEIMMDNTLEWATAVVSTEVHDYANARAAKILLRELERLRFAQDTLRTEAEYLRKLVATHDKWVYALGRLSRLHPTMIIDVNDPEGMAVQIEAHVRASCPNLDRISPLYGDLPESEGRN